MNVETIVNDVKEAVEPVLAKGQDVVVASFETLKAANAIVVEGVQTLVQTQIDLNKDLFGLAQDSFEKARTDGLKAVVSDPISYLPEGKDRVISAYNDSVAAVTKTGDDLFKTFKNGFETITAKINGEEPAAPKARKTVKKAGARTRKTVKASATA